MPLKTRFENIDQALLEVRDALPKIIYEELRDNVHEAINASEVETKLYERRTVLLGVLATAGISALAIEHETYKQYTILEALTGDLRSIQIENESTRRNMLSMAGRIESWIERSRATRAHFSHLLNEDDREMQARFRAKQLIHDVVEQTRILLRGIRIDIADIDDSLLLPHGNFAGWNAIFQNVLINAVNALLDSHEREVVISSRKRGKIHEILVQDTGVGVDLDTSDSLFEPFIRRLEISKERRGLGAGGTGLGLTIVRMIAESFGCRVSFVEPEQGYSTAFGLSWREQ